MTYSETIDYLFAQLPMFQRIGKAAYRANLDNTLALDRVLEHPHRSFASVHVAGTNGKGSSSHMLAAVLQQAGYRVGLYTSPHLIDFRERIRVNGQPIDPDYVVRFVERYRPVFEPMQLSFFELTVGLAFDFFRAAKVDIAVVEVGMGGRLDSTNILQPVLSLITNIGLDHVEFLGHDLVSIAGEKAGIIKPRTPVVVSQRQPLVDAVFAQRAQLLEAPLVFASEVFQVPYSTQGTNGKQYMQVYANGNLRWPNLELDLLGIYQRHNLPGVLVAVERLHQIGYTVPEQALRAGLARTAASTGLMGRWQVLGHNPLMVCDTGHNEDGIRQVLAQVQATAYRRLHWVLGMVSDKDVSKVLALLPAEAQYYFTRAQLPRALPAAQLQQYALGFGLQGQAYERVPDAVCAARRCAQPSDLILIGGSTFVVADALAPGGLGC